MQTPADQATIQAGFLVKWSILVLGSFMVFCDFYCLWVPVSLQELTFSYFEEQYSRFEDPYGSFVKDFTLMLTLFNLPNAVLPLLNGYLATKVRIFHIWTLPMLHHSIHHLNFLPIVFPFFIRPLCLFYLIIVAILFP